MGQRSEFNIVNLQMDGLTIDSLRDTKVDILYYVCTWTVGFCSLLYGPRPQIVLKQQIKAQF